MSQRCSTGFCCLYFLPCRSCNEWVLEALIWWHRGLTASSPPPAVAAKKPHFNKSISPLVTLKNWRNANEAPLVVGSDIARKKMMHLKKTPTFRPQMCCSKTGRVRAGRSVERDVPAPPVFSCSHADSCSGFKPD